jgi:hypothetical protein
MNDLIGKTCLIQTDLNDSATPRSSGPRPPPSPPLPLARPIGPLRARLRRRVPLAPRRL